MVVGQSHYSVSKKYFRSKCYFVTPKDVCECCGMQLRASPAGRGLELRKLMSWSENDNLCSYTISNFL